MSDIVTIPVFPALPIELVVSHTLYTRHITSLCVVHPPAPDGITSVFASSASGVETVYTTLDTDRWPAWVKGLVPLETDAPRATVLQSIRKFLSL